MDLKFKDILNSFIPKGRAWENNKYLEYLVDGMSSEFGRVHKDIKTFYENFNIINSTSLAQEHSKDYLIVQGLYTNAELQRIIVEYLNKDYDYLEALEDFASFINVPIQFINFPTPIEFGEFQFGDEFGDPNASSTLNLYISYELVENLSCRDYNKIRWLAEYLKPPYLSLTFTNPPSDNIVYFEIGLSQFGDEFGGIEPCEIIL